VNVSQLLDTSITRLTPLFDTARLDAEVLLSFALGWSRTHLITRDKELLSAEQINVVTRLMSRRVSGEPVAYIVGEQEFWSLPLKVNTSTLIPRPETEHLVEAALTCLPKNETKSVLDLGTGSGAIVLALATERPLNQYAAVDISAEALNVARHNANNLKLTGITFLQGSWFSPLVQQRFDLIVSNPPYIESTDEHLCQGDVAAEPVSALVSGKDGLDDIRIISERAKSFLVDSGWLMMEHGWNQAADVRGILAANTYQNIHTIKDFSDMERLTIAQFKSTDES